MASLSHHQSHPHFVPVCGAHCTLQSLRYFPLEPPSRPSFVPLAVGPSRRCLRFFSRCMGAFFFSVKILFSPRQALFSGVYLPVL